MSKVNVEKHFDTPRWQQESAYYWSHDPVLMVWSIILLGEAKVHMAKGGFRGRALAPPPGTPSHSFGQFHKYYLLSPFSLEPVVKTVIIVQCENVNNN